MISVFRIVFFLFLTISTINAQLIVFKYDSAEKNNVAALQESDEENWDAIFATLQKYSTPMCFGHLDELTEQEVKELFAAEPYAEQKFIRKKIQEINELYDVIFIPTTLFELFIIEQYFNKKFNFDDEEANLLADLDNNFIEVLKNKKAHKKSVFKVHQKINSSFKENYFQVHKDFFDFLDHATASIFLKGITLDLFESFLKKNISKIAAELIISITALQEKHDRRRCNNLDNIPFDFTNLKSDVFVHSKSPVLKKHSYVAQAIKLEYEEQENNTFLLYRGSKGTVHDVRAQKNVTKENVFEKKTSRRDLLDSTLLGQDDSIFLNGDQFLKMEYHPISLSFGNSLFAGSIIDSLANAYCHLKDKQRGYSLAINKMDYLDCSKQNNHNNRKRFAPLLKVTNP